jgi:hypothetical protein
MKSFWVKFGRADARSMAEARQAMVSFFFSLAKFGLQSFCYLFFVPCFMLMASALYAGVAKDGDCSCCCGGVDF